MKNTCDENFKTLVNDILENGYVKDDRTGVGTVSKFGHQYRYDLKEGFPLLTLRKIHTKSLIHELLWFLKAYDEKYDKFGNTNIKYLVDHGVSFWTDWPYKAYVEDKKAIGETYLSQKEFQEKIKTDDDFALAYGDLGPVYGKQWNDFGGYNGLEGFNQIDDVLDQLINNPDSRRIIIDSWDPTKLKDMALPPCHMLFQFYTRELTLMERNSISPVKVKGILNEMTPDYLKRGAENMFNKHNVPTRGLSCQLYMRSNDVYLGNPFNVACYSILVEMMAQVTGMVADEFILTLGDGHLYSNSLEATKEVCKRKSFDMPILKLNKEIKELRDFRYDDIKIENYKSHKNIKVEVAV